MAMSKAAIDKAAGILWRARLECQRLQSLPEDCRPATLDEGYAVQDAMAASCGQAVAGWKIAATSEAGQRHIGVSEPIGGRLFADFVLAGWRGSAGSTVADAGDGGGIRLPHGAEPRPARERL